MFGFMSLESVLLGFYVLSLCLSLLLSIPGIQTYSRAFNHAVRNKPLVYRDLDGEAFPESPSSQQTSNLIFNASYVLGAVLGNCIAILRAYFSTVDKGVLQAQNWLQVGIWIFILSQSIALLIESQRNKRYRIGKNSSLCCMLMLIAQWLSTFRDQGRIPEGKLSAHLQDAQVGTTVILLLLALSVPRRPEVFVDEKMVDRENTCSLLSLWTFSWPGMLLDLTMDKKSVSIDDLPVLGFESRARYLLESFERAKGTIMSRTSAPAPLWWIIILANLKYVICQFTLSLLLCFVMFTPHLALMRILHLLQSGYTIEHDRADLWFWVLIFGTLTSCSSFLENWVHWISQNKISIRIQEQLTMIIYNRAMQLDGVPVSPDDVDEAIKTAESDRMSGTGTQSISNIVSVDTHRIAKCATILARVATVPLRLLIAGLLVGRLLGWQSFVSTMAILLTIAPLKFWCLAKYMTTEGKLMSRRDRRVVTLNEALQGIRQIKLSATEAQWEGKIDKLRTAELKTQEKTFILASVSIAMQLLGSLLLSAGALAIHAIFFGSPEPAVAFTALSILGSIDMIMSTLPELLIEILDAAVSLRRVERFFQGNERVAKHVPSDIISFENVTVTWKQDTGSKSSCPDSLWALRGLSFSLPKHGLSVVTGPTGSGKSMLLAAILGECEIREGIVKSPIMTTAPARFNYPDVEDDWIQDLYMAYVSQSPWIEAATVRENILFGLPFNAQRYQGVLFACCLLQDLQSLPLGDATEIRHNGVNLSGGQKWRIALARALYSRAGILILDDIFSAVDVHTARHLYEHALTGSLAVGRTRVLVTHYLGLCLPRTDYVLYLQGGKIEQKGTVTELRESGLLETLLGWEAVKSSLEVDHRGNRRVPVSLAEEPTDSHCTLHSSSQVEGTDGMTAEEGRQSGAITFKQIQHYLCKSGRWRFGICVAVCYLAFSCLILARNWWVKLWSSNKLSRTILEQTMAPGHGPTQQAITPIEIDDDLFYYIRIYLALSSLAWVVGSLRSCVVLVASLKASRIMFQELLSAVLHAPLRWIDTTPMGRLINRFTSDFDMLDAYMGFDLNNLLVGATDCMVVLLASVLGNPALVLVAMPILLFCVWYSRQYLIMAREMKRLESISRSPIYDQLDSSLAGLWTIRAFGRTGDYVNKMQTKVDYHARATWQLWLLSRWLGFRMNMISSVFCVLTATTIIFLGNANASLAGFVLGFTIQLTHAMAKAILSYACFELDMNGVERVVEYTEIKTENLRGLDPPAAWPTEGRVEVLDLVVSYAPELPPVIKGISFQIESHQRVGVIGRTGAGKSSLALALFRFLEAREGQIMIDGLDISRINLHQLRRRLAIIPQNPVLFSGTVRSNLDPFAERTDAELLSALEQVHWTSRLSPAQTAKADVYESGVEVQTVNEGLTLPREGLFKDSLISLLDYPVSESGSNLSQGKRQLLCLARAVALKPKLVVLDEATSSVDKNIDRLIQKSLRSEFINTSTLIVIAHRLSTIADYDRILVLDAGQAVEFGHPADLMRAKDGAFRAMVENDLERDAIKRMIKIRDS